MKKISRYNLSEIAYYYSKKGSITEKNVRALVLRFLMENEKVDEFVKCYRYSHGHDYHVEDIFDDSVNCLFKRGDKIEDYFNMIPVSFQWSTCEDNGLCKPGTWGHISEEWKQLTRYLRYGGEKNEKF